MKLFLFCCCAFFFLLLCGFFKIGIELKFEALLLLLSFYGETRHIVTVNIEEITTTKTILDLLTVNCAVILLQLILFSGKEINTTKKFISFRQDVRKSIIP